jgi:ABC-type transporter Mla subunit MlaD
MNGLKTAFFASIGGVLLLIISSRFIEYRQWKNEIGKLSDETIALNKIVILLGQMKEETADNFTYTDENNNKVKPANVFRDIYTESKKQSQALQSFSTSMADTINAGFEKLIGEQNHLNTIPYIEKLRQEIVTLSNKQDKMVEEFKTSMYSGFEKVVGQQNDLNTIPILEKLQVEIEGLGNKLQDPTNEMTQNVVKDLEAALERMVNEFKTSVSGSAKSELESLAKLLGQAGSSLTDFPKKLEEMTNNLNENFRGLQGVVEQISQQTLTQSTESTGAMKKQLDDITSVFKENIGTLQSGQSELITKQSENVKLSDGLLNAFNTSIVKMNSLSDGVNETIKKFDRVQTDLNLAAGQLKSVSENVNTSSSSIKDAQLKFSEQSNHFLTANAKTIEEIQKALSLAKNTSDDYVQKFTIIEEGLKGIFTQIQTGLHDYRDTVGNSLEMLLGKYSVELTKSTDALSGAIKIQEDSMVELTEVLSKFNTLKSQRN